MTTPPTADFDRSQFDQHIPLIALDIPAKLCTKYTQALKGFVLSRPRVKKIYDGMDKERRTLVLAEAVGNDPTLAALPDEGREFIAQNDGKVVDSFHPFQSPIRLPFQPHFRSPYPIL